MREFGKISHRLWSSRKFRECSMAAQLLYVHLHTNPECTSAGLLSIRPSVISAAMITEKAEWERPEVERRLAELHDAKLIIWDEDEELILITQFLGAEFNPITNGKHGRGVLRSLKHVRNERIKLAVLVQLEPYFEKMFDDDVSDAKATISRIRDQQTQGGSQKHDTPSIPLSKGYRTETQTQTQTQIPLTPKGLEKGERQTPRKSGTNPRARGANPRAAHSTGKRSPPPPPGEVPEQFADGWIRVLGTMARTLEPAEVETWLMPLSPVDLTDGVLHVRAPSRFAADHVKAHYGGTLGTACKKHFGSLSVEMFA